MNDQLMVFVRCMTYNHSEYIRYAMDGFCMQQTNFPYVCGIIDDASTDGEQSVIHDYLKEHFNLNDNKIVTHEETNDYIRIFAQHKINKNCYFAVVYLKYNHYRKKSKNPYVAKWNNKAKYIALCEGDDYWIDALKLQKQVEFMESHPLNSLCFCGHRNEYPDGSTRNRCRYNRDMDDCPAKDAIHFGGGYMATASMFYRRDCVEDLPQWSIGLPIGDAPLMLVLLGRGRFGYLNRIMVVYRVATVGSWSRMIESDRSKKRSLLSSVKKMYQGFDSWTNKKYHSLILKKCLMIDINILRLKLGLLK